MDIKKSYDQHPAKAICNVMLKTSQGVLFLWVVAALVMNIEEEEEFVEKEEDEG